MVNVIKVSKLALMASVLIGSIPCVHAMNKDDFKAQLNATLGQPQKQAAAAAAYSKAADGYNNVFQNTPVKKNTQIEEKKAAVDGIELQKKLQARQAKEEQKPAAPRVIQYLIDPREKNPAPEQIVKNDSFKEVSVYRKQPATDPTKANLKITTDVKIILPVSVIVPNYRKQPQPTGPANLYQKTEEETILPTVILQKK